MSKISHISWIDLLAALRVADEATCRRLFHNEAAGGRREGFLIRIHGVFNRLRGERERNAIIGRLMTELP